MTVVSQAFGARGAPRRLGRAGADQMVSDPGHPADRGAPPRRECHCAGSESFRLNKDWLETPSSFSLAKKAFFVAFSF